MLNAAHPSHYSIYWQPEDPQPKRRPYALWISLAAAVMAIGTSGVVVAGNLNRLPDPETIAVKNTDTGAPPVPAYDTTITALPGATTLSAD